jgi:glutamyl-tRNA synthetase
MTVVTRFAPSPTGFLHIGGARTALYNWLYARRHGGRFLLRIEDTDRARSTKEAVDAIVDGLRWLGLDWDGEAVSQFARAARHAEAARALLAQGAAYPCYCSPAELAEMRERAKREGRPLRYDGRWRDRDASEAPPGVAPAIRLRAPATGETAIADMVQGEVRVANEELDDMVLLRADGTPTYMLAVVVDDHDAEITHVIRGTDHLTNAFRQMQLYRAFGWEPPRFAHIPLIHGPDGAKLSKRHGALGVDAYRDMGFLPEALCNYLLRLGWAHGDDEIIGREQAIRWFDLDAVGRSPARFDMAKLLNLNGHYLRQADDARLVDLVLPRLGRRLGGRTAAQAPARLLQGMAGLKERAKTLAELAENAVFYAAERPLAPNAKARDLLDGEAVGRLARLRERLTGLAVWGAAGLEKETRDLAAADGIKLAALAQPLRAALTGMTASPGIFEVMEVLGREETLGRLDDVRAEELARSRPA